MVSKWTQAVKIRMGVCCAEEVCYTPRRRNGDHPSGREFPSVAWPGRGTLTAVVVADGSAAGEGARLFGPHTVTWQLHADPVMWLAGVCALYLQALHPRAVAGVTQNSDFRTDPWGRLRRTADFVGVVTYGTLRQAGAAAARVRRIHHTLCAVDPDTGRRFRLDEPDLLLWVHCATVGCFLTVGRRAGIPLSRTRADRYVEEQRRAAELVGLDPEEVPGSVAELAAYFARVRPVLRRTPDAEEVHRFLRRPPLPWWLAGVRLSYLPVGELAYSLLPTWALRLYGHPALPGAAATAALRAVRTAALLVPGDVRWRLPGSPLGEALRDLGPSGRPSWGDLPV